MSARRRPVRVPQSPWHWATAAAGLLLLLAVVGYLLYDGVVRGRTPDPVLTVTADTVAATPGGHVVRVRVRNAGGAAAANLRVLGELRDGERVVERTEASLDYVPPRSARDAGLVFARDPRGLRVVVRPGGFDLP